MKKLLLLFLLVSTTLLGQSTKKLPNRNTVSGSKKVLTVPITVGSRKILPVVASETFFISTSAIVSAGVYRSSDSVQVRTILKNVSYPAGSITVEWDGKDDYGQPVAGISTGSHYFGLVSNNIVPQYEGTVGNSASGQPAGDRHRGYQFARGLLEVGNWLYIAQYYQESQPSQAKILKTDLQKKVNFLPSGANFASEDLCTDGTYIYWTCYDLFSPGGNGKVTGVIATKVSDDTRVTFPSGTTYTCGQGSYVNSVIDYRNTFNYVTGIAVQTTGNYLYIAHASTNEVTCLNKTTGAFVATYTFTNARQIRMDGDNNIIIVSGTNTVGKYPVNVSTGAITTTPTLTFAGIAKPINTAVKSGILAVCDGDTAQRVKAYNTTTGAYSYIIGQKGGNRSTPDVADDRFYFSDAATAIEYGFFCFTSDGFWVGDGGNYRIQHFNSSRTYVDNIQYVVASYTSSIDKANINRLFNQYLEYQIDYTKPLDPNNGSWKLVKNWRPNIPTTYFRLDNKLQSVDMFGVFSSLSTLSNGRTYAFNRVLATGKYVLFELTSTGAREIPSISLDPPIEIGDDGALYRAYLTGTSPNQMRWGRRPLNSFDGSGNPVWGTETVVASITNLYDGDPIDWSGFGTGQPSVRNKKGHYFAFQPNMVTINYGTVHGWGHHMGSVKPGDTKWLWRGAMATSGVLYKGPYPTDGSYDVGNHANFVINNQNGYAGGGINVLGNIAIWGYYGEFWKDGQTNKFQMLDEHGLPLGTFGFTSEDARKTSSGYLDGMAGGVHAFQTVVDPSNSDIGYLYYAAEGGPSGLDRWKLTGLNSVKYQTKTAFVVNKQTAGLDAHADFTKTPATTSGVIADGQFGVTRSDPVENGERTVQYGALTYDRSDTPDFYVSNNNQSGNFVVTKLLGNADNPTPTSATSWTLTYNLQATRSYPNIGFKGQTGAGDVGGVYIELLDANNKIITRYEQRLTGSNLQLMANGVVLAQGNYNTNSPLVNQAPIVITSNGTNITYKYADNPAQTITKFDGTASLLSPTRHNISFWNEGQNQGRVVGITKSRLVTIGNTYVKPVTQRDTALMYSDTTQGRITRALMTTVNLTTEAEIRNALTTPQTNKRFVVANGTYTLGSALGQTANWTNVLFEPATPLGVTFRYDGGTVVFIFTTAHTINAVEIGAFKFVSHNTGTQYAVFYSNELVGGDGLKIDGIDVTNDGFGSFNGVGMAQYSTGSSSGATITHVWFNNIHVHDVSRSNEFLSQGYDYARIIGLAITNSLFENMGTNSTYGFGSSISGLIKGVLVKNNTYINCKQISLELVNVQYALATGNSITVNNTNVVTGIGISDDGVNSTRYIYSENNVVNTTGRPFYAYGANYIFFNGGKYTGKYGVDMTSDYCIFKNMDVFVYDKVSTGGAGTSYAWQVDVAANNNLFDNVTVSSSGTISNGGLYAREVMVVKGTFNIIQNCKFVQGKQQGGTFYGFELAISGANNTSVNNTKLSGT